MQVQIMKEARALMLVATSVLLAALAACGEGNSFASDPPAGAPPSPPSGLSAAAGNAQASLTWSAASGATSYKVKRSNSSGAAYTVVRTQAQTSGFTDTGLTNGATYYYVVSAVNAAGESADSSQVAATPRGPVQAPAAPSGVTASAGNAQVSLRWDAVAGAAGYKVYRGASLVASPSSNSFADTGLTNGTAYTYQVSATNSAGEGAKSSSVSATPQRAVATACDLPNYPDASCTGVPPGTALTVVNGDLNITVANTVIDGKDIRGCVLIKAPGVIIRNSKISCDNSVVVASFNAANGGYSGTGLLVEDSEITCNNTNGTAVGDYNFTVRRVNIHRCENGFDADGEITVEDSYIHDLYEGAQGLGHADGMQITPRGSNITVRHNTILPGASTTSAIITPRVGAGVVSNILIQNNLLAGGAFTLYCPGGGSGNNFRVIGNHFSTVFYPTVGAFGAWTDCKDEAQVAGNVYHESGQSLLPE